MFLQERDNAEIYDEKGEHIDYGMIVNCAGSHDGENKYVVFIYSIEEVRFLGESQLKKVDLTMPKKTTVE